MKVLMSARAAKRRVTGRSVSAWLIMAAMLFAPATALAWDDPRTDVERFSVIPDASHYFFLRQAQLGEDIPDWGLGVVFQ
ncbi:MAG: hypothetical protein ACI9OJ_000341 [Myxococcota bacterium]|jgi:uncharacterized protein YfaP (DUF2135 family)